VPARRWAQHVHVERKSIAPDAAVHESAEMRNSKPSIIETRRDQIFPHLDATDIERAGASAKYAASRPAMRWWRSAKSA
jgi:hypothetical protein